MDKSSEENEIVLPWRVAVTLFQYQVMNKALNQGKALSDVMDILDRGKAGEMVEELKAWMDELVTEAGDEPIIRYGLSGDPSGIDYSVREHPAGLQLLAKSLIGQSFARSRPTEEGGLMVGPGSPFYGRRIMRDPKELLASFPPEMIDQMGNELAASYAGELPKIKGVIAGDGFYKPAVVDELEYDEVVQLGLVYDIYPAGQVPDDQRESLHDWMVKNNGSLGWHASAQTKENIEAMRKGTVHIRDLPGAYLSLTVATGAPFWGDQKRQANKRNQEE